MEIYDRPFGDYDFAKIIEDMARPKWRYGHASVSKDHDIPFWEMTLVDEPFYTEYLLNIIRDVTNEPDLTLEPVSYTHLTLPTICSV